MSEIFTTPVGRIGSAGEQAKTRSGHVGRHATFAVAATALGAGWYTGLVSGFPEASNAPRRRALIRNFPPLMPGPP